MPYPSNLPPFCLERWQSEREASARILLSESGVSPPKLDELRALGADFDLYSVELGYGWTNGDPRLRRAIAEYYGGITEDHVLVTTGSAEANMLAVLSIVSPGDTVIVDMPNYMQVPGILQARNAEIYEAWRSPRNDWHIPIKEVLELLKREKPRGVFLTNPNNPTGTVEVDSLKALAEEAEKYNTIIVVDEVYRGLEHSVERAPSIIELSKRYNITAVATSGLSKVYGLPGLRIGWIASNSVEIIEKAWSVKDYTTISPARLSEAIAISVLHPSVRSRLEERARRIVQRNLNAFREVLGEYSGVIEPWWPEAGAFILARTPWTKDTLGLAHALYKEKGILVNPGECFDLPGTLRIGLGHEDPMYSRMAYKELMRAVSNYMRGKKI